MTQKSKRLSLRLTSQQDTVLRKAAGARGESVNDFIVRNAVEAASRELSDRTGFVLDDVEWDELQSLLSRPPAIPRALIELLSERTVLE